MKTAEEQVAELNKLHFVAQEGGRTRVYNERWDSVMKRNIITSSSFDDLRNLYLNQYVLIEMAKDNKVESKSFKLGQFWLGSPERRQYEEIAFEPGKLLGPEIYNLWRGFDIEENQNGSWELLRRHLIDNVCCGNMDYFNYYLDWWANTIQHPDQQANVAMVLKGKRGGGKGSAIGYFAELFGQHHIHVFSSRQITGNFNYHLRDAVVLFSDEAIYAGNKAEESVLKGLITERYIPIEGKHRDLIMVRNNLHVIMSTNNQWAVPAGLDERRFFVLNMKDDDAVKQNSAYFNAIKLQMDNGGRGRLLHDMLQRDIKRFDTYKAPNTVGLLEQKIESFDSVHGWWYGCLNGGAIFDGWDWEVAFPAEAVYNNYLAYCKNSGNSKYHNNPTHFGRFLSSMMPGEYPHLHRAKCDNWFYDVKLVTDRVKRITHYEMAPLADCRVIFEKEIGHKINWPVPIGESTQTKADEPETI